MLISTHSRCIIVWKCSIFGKSKRLVKSCSLCEIGYWKVDVDICHKEDNRINNQIIGNKNLFSSWFYRYLSCNCLWDSYIFFIYTLVFFDDNSPCVISTYRLSISQSGEVFVWVAWRKSSTKYHGGAIGS